MTSVWIGFLMLGVTIVAHIFLVSLVLGLAVMAPIIEYWAYRTGDKELEAVAKDTLKYMAVSELAAGVWATWFTVALAGFWPQLTFIATDVLFYPLTIALFGVMLGIPLMAVYWYTWDTVSKKLHIAIGSFMALGAMLVPTGFNMIFAFLDDPVGMAGALHGNGWAVFANPLYPDFTFHRITAAISMVALAISAIYSLKASTGEEHYLKASKFGLYVGLPALLLASISGAAYALELDKYSPYVASSVLGPLSATSLSTYFHLYPAFVGFMGIVTLIWAASIFNVLHQAFDWAKKASSWVLLVSALVGVPYGEVLNDLPRYPYMVITGTGGLPASLFINHWMDIPQVFAVAAFAVGAVLMAAFSYMIYLVFVSKLPGKKVSGGE
ncbi:MAG: cytochrome ubiquinol oxidase subunit I [Thermoprotei archaeon]